MKQIKLQAGAKALLSRTFGVSRVTVWSALAYKTNSDVANKIRNKALSMGGHVVDVVEDDSFCPHCETAFVRGVDGGIQGIIQRFENGVQVRFDNDLCTAEILRAGRQVKSFDNVVMRDWCNIVHEAQSLADSLSK